MAAKALMALALLVLAAIHLPPAWQPVCPLRHLTGVPCLTCGSFRAVSALCAGKVGRAWLLQPLLTALALAGLAWVVYAMAGAWLRLSRLRMVFSRREAGLLAAMGLLALLANWLYLLRHGI